MATYAYLAGIISLVVGVVGCSAGFILYKKTKEKSTFLIALGYLIGISSALIFYGVNAFNFDPKKIEIILLFSYLSGPITVTGLLVYAIKLKNEKISNK